MCCQKKKRLVVATFLPSLNYGDHLCMHAPAQILRQLNAVQWPSLASCYTFTGTYLFINPSLVCFPLTFVGTSQSKPVIITCAQMINFC